MKALSTRLKGNQKRLREAEQAFLRPILEKLRGYYFLLCGAHRSLTWLPPHHLYAMNVFPQIMPEMKVTVQSYFEYLPFREESIDAILVPYLLEFLEAPELFLKELFRCLLHEGNLFLFGFARWHPWCWWNAPTAKKTLSLSDIQDMLESIDFTLQSVHYLHYGAIYCLHAKKQVVGVTPLKVDWKTDAVTDALIQSTAQRGSS